MEREIARRGELPTELRWLYDPQDYLRPSLMTFDPRDPRWGGPECLARRLRVRPRGIGRVRIGAPATEPRLCVDGGGEVSVTADAGGLIRSVKTTAPMHRTRGIGVGSPLKLVRQRYRRARETRRGLYRASPGSRIYFAIRGGRVRHIVVTRG
jgi:hypothetical protein